MFSNVKRKEDDKGFAEMTDYSGMRRLSDKIIAAHAQACHDGRLDVAEMLLQALELELSVIGGENADDHRESTESLEKAFDLHQRTRATQVAG